MVNFKNEQSLVYYHGDSMARTFKSGDHLIIKPFYWIDIHPGDIVVFTKKDKQVVHRVMVISNEKFITCGDNNPHNDLEPVTQENGIGVVVGFIRNGKLHPVIGGKLGLLRFRVLRIVSKLWKFIRLGGLTPYNFIKPKKKQLIGRIWQPQIEQMTAILEQETVIKYLHRGRTVARWWPSRHYFECRKPYDLVIPDPEKIKQP